MFILNEISIDSQFSNADEFSLQLGKLLKLKSRFQHLRENFKVSYKTVDRKINSDLTVRQAINRDRNQERKRLVLIWLTSGPFHEKDRIPEEDDYFEFEGVDVTDFGLGEAARRIKSCISAKTFSFQGGNLNFSTTPLRVDHGLEGDRLGSYSVDNFWTINGLESEVKSVRPQANSWEQLVSFAAEDYPNLKFSRSICEHQALKREPFDKTVARAADSLLGKLNRYMEIVGRDGYESASAKEIISDYFSGSRALFSAESPTNQVKFHRQMTFEDPDNPSNTIFAHWHGKISHRFYRLHFEWPLPENQQYIKICYLGPKITKK